MDPKRFPEDWGLYDTKLYLSGSHQLVLGRHYPPGFSFETGLKLFGIKASVSASMFMVNVFGVRVPNLKFEAELDMTEAYAALEHKMKELAPDALKNPLKLNPRSWVKVIEYHSYNFATSFVKLNRIAVENLSLLSLGKGKTAAFVLDFEFWGHRHELRLEINLWDLGKRAIDWVMDQLKYIRDLFVLPECAFDWDCKKNRNGQFCVWGSCSAGRTGDSCFLDYQCKGVVGSNGHCTWGKCYTGAAGSKCDWNADCDGACVSGKCRDGKEGDPCHIDSDCIDRKCNHFKCRAGRKGDPCHWDSDCNGSLKCRGKQWWKFGLDNKCT